MKCVDSSVAVDHLRGREDARTTLRAASVDDELIASEVVRFELIAGVRSREVHALEAFFRAIAWVPVTEQIAREAGAFARRYRRSHASIDDSDYLIAATAHVFGAELLTTNVEHFPMYPKLRQPY